MSYIRYIFKYSYSIKFFPEKLKCKEHVPGSEVNSDWVLNSWS